MAEQRNVPLESGGTIRVTEAIMRGTGPQGPKGDKGDIGTGTIIKGSKELCADIKSMRAEDGDGWICEEDGHLYVYSLEKEESGSHEPWIDCGKIVGPEGKIVSLGAEWQTTAQQWIFDDDIRETTLKWDQVNYNDEEKVVAADGTETTVPLVTLGDDGTTTPFDKWNYQYSSWTTLSEVPVHIIDVDVRFVAQKTDGSATTHAGPVTIRLYKFDGSDANATWNLETVETRYMDSNEATHATMNLSWAGKTKHTDVFKVAIVSQVSGYVTWSRVQTARAGGNAGPPGVQGLKGDRGEQGEQGFMGRDGQGVSPTGTIIAFAGGPEDIPSYYERDGDNANIENDIQYDNATGLPYVMAQPEWLPCDGTTVPVGTRLRDLLGMRKTPNLMGRMLIGTNSAGWVKQGRLHRNQNLGNTPNTWWDDTVGSHFGGNNVLTLSQIPAHKHGVEVKSGYPDVTITSADGKRSARTKGWSNISDGKRRHDDNIEDAKFDWRHNHGVNAQGNTDPEGKTTYDGKHVHNMEHKHWSTNFGVKQTNNTTRNTKGKNLDNDGHKATNVSGHLTAGDLNTTGALTMGSTYSNKKERDNVSEAGNHRHEIERNGKVIYFDHYHALDLEVDVEVKLDEDSKGGGQAHQHPHADIIYLIKT